MSVNISWNRDYNFTYQFYSQAVVSFIFKNFVTEGCDICDKVELVNGQSHSVPVSLLNLRHPCEYLQYIFGK